MKFNSPKQLKDWISNKEVNEGIPPNTLLNYYMMERLLERISISKYASSFIFKGGFLISSMIGVNLRSTLDMDATIKGILVSEEQILEVVDEIIKEDVDDNVSFSIVNIKSIHSSGKYQDYRITLGANFFNIREFLKLDITTGDLLVPKEIFYEYKLMFENRSINIMAYHLYTILAEKLETILSRNIANTRARDFYDLYMLTKIYGHNIDEDNLKLVLTKKFEERNTTRYLEESSKYLDLIIESPELNNIWINYKNKHNYAENIEWTDIITSIKILLD